MDAQKTVLLEYWKNTGLIKDERLLKAFEAVDREDFILPKYILVAYHDLPIPIGMGQTISQPSTVMMMIQALELKSTDIVLEIGGGSGYNAAIMSKLCKKVYSLEIISELVEFAKNNLKTAKISNVEIILGDGSVGYEKMAPYDKIIVTAAAPKLPYELISQLKEGGIIVIPVGEIVQKMIVAKKVKGEMIYTDLGEFQFVELRGKKGFG